MASNKTEQPTPQRLRELRERGDVAKSADLVSVGSFLCAAIALVGLSPWIFRRAQTYFRASLQQANIQSVTQTNTLPSNELTQALHESATILCGILLSVMLGAFLMNYIQVGLRFNMKSLSLNLKRLDPASNIRQKLSSTMIYTMLKIFVFIIFFFCCAYLFCKARLPILGNHISSTRSISDLVLFFGQSLKSSLLFVVPLILILAGIDYVYQRQRFLRKNRMSKDEVMREFKENEGDPQLKSDRKRLHQEILEHQMLERVTKADCVIVNPTHLAIAVKYDEDESDAPLVLAKGQRKLAERIREIAKQAGVPIVRNVPLARALYELEIDDAIPEELFEAMAEVLRFVYEQFGSR